MMKVATITAYNVAIQLSIKEVEFFLKIIQEVQQAIPNSFTTRVGVSPRQARGFFEAIIQEIKQSGETLMIISFLYQEMFLFQSLLNEVYNGIVLNDFPIRLGKSEEEVKELLQWVCNLTKEMKALQKARRASYMPSPSNSTETRENDDTKKRHAACIRISSEKLSAVEITSRLGIEPTRSYEKGTRMNPRNPKSRIRQKSVWIFESGIDAEDPFDIHLEKLVSFIEDKTEQLQQLMLICYMDIFCGFFAEEGQGTFHIKAELLKRIMVIPIDIVIDLYPPSGTLEAE